MTTIETARMILAAELLYVAYLVFDIMKIKKEIAS